MEINDLKNKILEKLKESSLDGADVASILQKDSPKVKEPEKTADQELVVLKKSLDEYRNRLDAAEFKNRELKKLYDEIVKKHDLMAGQFEDKKRMIPGLDKKIPAQGDSQKKEKTIDGLEILKSRVITLTKEARDKDIAISTLQDSLKAKERKLAENDKIYKNFEAEKNELASTLQSVEKQKKALNEKLLQTMVDLEKKDREISDHSKRYNKDVEVVKSDLELKLQASEREKKALEGKISQLNLEIGAKNKRLDELEESYKDLDDMLKEAMMKVQAAKTEKEDLEEQVSQLTLDIETADKKRRDAVALVESEVQRLDKELSRTKKTIQDKERELVELGETVDALKSDVEARDNKIAADIKYYEKLLKEITELKAKDKIR